MKMVNPYYCDGCGKMVEDALDMTTVTISFPGFPDEVFEYHPKCAQETMRQPTQQAHLVRKYYLEAKIG